MSAETCKRGHPRDVHTYERPDGTHYCAACNLEASLRWKQENRERNRARDREFGRARRASGLSDAGDKIYGSTQIGPSGAPTPPGRGSEPQEVRQHG